MTLESCRTQKIFGKFNSEGFAGQPDYTLNKNKLNNKVETVCIYCENTTCLRHFTMTCEK